MSNFRFSIPQISRASAVTLLIACLLMGWVWTWQAHRNAGKVDLGGYHFDNRGQAPYLRWLSEFLEWQTIHDGEISVHSFSTLEPNAYEGEDADTVTRVEARVLVPKDNWVDIVGRSTFHGSIAFRLSRCLGIDSGWYVYHRSECYLHVPADTSTVASVGAIADSRLRANLKLYSLRSPHNSRALLDEAFESEWIDLALEMHGTTFEAWVNGESQGKIDLTAEIELDHPGLTAEQSSLEFLSQGHTGVRAGSRPPIRVDRIQVEGLSRDGGPLDVDLTFDTPSLFSLDWLLVLGTNCLLFIVGIALGIWLVHWALPGFDANRIVRWAIGGMACTFLFTLWVEWRSLIDYQEVLPGHRVGQVVFLVLLGFLLVVRNRRHFRCRLAGHEHAVMPMRERMAWGLMIVAAALLFILAWKNLQWPPPGPPSMLEIAASEEPFEWSPEEAFHIPVLRVGRASVSLDLNMMVTLASDDAVLEVYFDRVQEEQTRIPQWSALRLTPQGVAIVESEGYEPALSPPGLDVDKPYCVRLSIEDGRLTASVLEESETGPSIAEISRPWHWQQAGAVGIVGRGGAGSVSLLEGTVGDFARSGVEYQSLTTSAKYKPTWLLLATLSWSIAVALLLALFTKVAGASPGTATFKWGLITAGVCCLAGGWRWWYQFSPPNGLPDWAATHVFTMPVMVGVVLWWVFWICNQRMLKRVTPVLILFLLVTLTLIEVLARQCPHRDLWQVGTRPGYVLRDFLFADRSAKLVWVEYTGDIDYNDEMCPRAIPEGGERRVFCMGGSSTWGAGATGGEYEYPRQLEALLQEREPDEHWNVFNAGLPDFTIVDDLLRLRRDVLERHPEIIVLYIGGNDNKAKDTPTMPQREMLEFVRQLNEPTLMNHLRQRLFGLHSFVGAASMFNALRGNAIDRFVTQVPVEDFEFFLRQFLEEATATNVRVILAPEVLFESISLDDDELRGHREVMARLADEFGLTLVDTIGAFRAHRNDLLMTDYIHPNNHGYEILAETIADAILSTPPSAEITN